MSLPSPVRFAPPRLQNLSIKARLSLVFVFLVLLMIIGGALSFLQIRRIRANAEQVSQVEQRMSAILRLNNNLLTLMAHLHRAADTEQGQFFEAEARRLLNEFRSRTAHASKVLADISTGSSRHTLLLSSVGAMLEALPYRIDSMIQLALHKDWPALHARLLNQADQTDDVVAAVMEQVDADLSDTRTRLLNDVQVAQRRAAQALVFTGLLSLSLAVLLGIVVTRSITQPLARLAAAARALAKGDFQYRVANTGNDELSSVAAVFNRTSAELEDLYTKLQLSEGRFRSLIEKGSDLIVVVNRSGELTYASPSSTRVLGYKPAELTSRSIRDLVHPEERMAGNRIFEGAARSSMQSFELRFRHQDGSDRILHGHVSNLLDDPSIGGFVVNARDVTERREAEAALMRSESQLRLITDSLPVLVSYVDRHGRYSFNNRLYEEWFGRSTDDLRGRRIADVLRPESYESIKSFVERALLGEPVTYETMMSYPGSQEERHVRSALIPDVAETGEIRGYVALVEDITADKRAESALRASEERLQTLLGREREARHTAELLNRIGLVLSAELDLPRLTQSVIDIATELLGAEFGAFFYNSENAEGKPFALYTLSGASRKLFEDFPMIRHTPLFARTFSGQGVVRSEDVTKHPDYGRNTPFHGMPEEHLPVRSYLGAPVVSRSGEVFGALLFGHKDIGVFTDREEAIVRGIAGQAAIAMDNARLFEQVRRERANAENAQAALKERAQQLARANADLQQFAYSASHDLQEPLRTVAIYSQLVRRKYGGKLDERADEYLGYLYRGARQMEQLVTDLLAYTKTGSITDAGCDVSTDVNTVLNRVLATLDPQIRANGCSVVFGELPRVRAHDFHVQQLFQNLIGNAIKYRSQNKPDVRIQAERKGPHWLFSVADNGIGIDPQYSNQIFGIFKRLHGHRYPGTGIGLALCRKIVEGYGGAIWVDSELGKGATFRFTLPAAEVVSACSIA
jgi:PAS domain S-box-containing protein